MAEDTTNSIYAYKYLFEVTAKNIKGGFSTVSGLSDEIEVVDMRDGTDPFQIRKIRGTRQGGSLTLGRGILKNRRDFFTWFKAVRDGAMPYVENMEIGINNVAESRSIVDVTFFGGWPYKYEIQDLDAKTSDLAVETLSIAHEGLGQKTGIMR
jgi:phage tail-like protein